MWQGSDRWLGLVFYVFFVLTYQEQLTTLFSSRFAARASFIILVWLLKGTDNARAPLSASAEERLFPPASCCAVLIARGCISGQTEKFTLHFRNSALFFRPVQKLSEGSFSLFCSQNPAACVTSLTDFLPPPWPFFVPLWPLKEVHKLQLHMVNRKTQRIYNILLLNCRGELCPRQQIRRCGDGDKSISWDLIISSIKMMSHPKTETSLLHSQNSAKPANNIHNICICSWQVEHTTCKRYILSPLLSKWCPNCNIVQLFSLCRQSILLQWHHSCSGFFTCPVIFQLKAAHDYIKHLHSYIQYKITFHW